MAKEKNYIAVSEIDTGSKQYKPGDAIAYDEALERAGSIVPAGEFEVPESSSNQDEAGKNYRVDETGMKIVDPDAAGPQPTQKPRRSVGGGAEANASEAGQQPDSGEAGDSSAVEEGTDVNANEESSSKKRRVR